MTYEQLKQNKAIRTYIERADDSLAANGYTEHSVAHVTHVAERAGRILETLGYPPHTVELARIAGYLHDIGNVVNRVSHSQSGALLAFYLLEQQGMAAEDIAQITVAIGNHDEGTGVPVSPIAAALILADKSDVRRSRVRVVEGQPFDIHDRVNASVKEGSLELNDDHTEIALSLQIDTAISAVANYFEIFMERMQMCRQAAQALGLRFRLFINDQCMM